MLTVKEFDDRIEIEGPGVVWVSETDLDGERFIKGVSQLHLDPWTPKPLLWAHGKDKSIKSAIGVVTSYRDEEEALWFKAQIDKNAKYLKSIKKLIELGVLGYSTGAVPDKITKSADGSIIDWPVQEVSLTPIPAEPLTLGVSFIKEVNSAIFGEEDGESGGGEEPNTEGEIPNKNEPTESSIKRTGGIVIMSEETTFDVGKFVKEWQATQAATDQKVASLSDNLNKLLTHIEKTPALMGAGFVTQDGGAADKNVKSFADFLLSVRRNDVTRLSKVYKAVKDLSAEAGTTGGFLLPPEYSTNLLQLAYSGNVVLNRVQTIPVSTDSGRWPSLDQYITPSAGTGQVAEAAGVQVNPALAGETLTKTEPSFEMLEWRLHKVGGYTEVDNELINDSPMSIEALLTGLFAVAVGAKNERNILRGSGVGEPLGILSSTAKIDVTPATNSVFGWTDVGVMYSRYRGAGGTPVWLIHPSIWPDIMNMTTPSGASAWSMNLQGPNGANLNGFQILTSEHLPQADSSGCVLLADLRGYVVWQRTGIEIAFSEHAAFTADQGTWRFTQRLDGKPWLKQPLVLPDPGGSYTVSPFVNFND